MHKNLSFTALQQLFTNLLETIILTTSEIKAKKLIEKIYTFLAPKVEVASWPTIDNGAEVINTKVTRIQI